MLTVDTLREFGADVATGMARCLNREDFYLRLVRTAAADPGYETLRAAIDEGDLGRAFEAAHALKGVTGNLALTPLYEPVAEMTEHLRAREDIDYEPWLGPIEARIAALRALVNE